MTMCIIFFFVHTFRYTIMLSKCMAFSHGHAVAKCRDVAIGGTHKNTSSAGMFHALKTLKNRFGKK